MKLYKNKHFQGFTKKNHQTDGVSDPLETQKQTLEEKEEVGPQSGAAAATLDFRACGSGELGAWVCPQGGAATSLLPQRPLSNLHQPRPCLPRPITSPPWTGNALSPGHLRVPHLCQDRLNAEVYDRRPISLLDPTFCGGGGPSPILHIYQLKRRASDKHVLSKSKANTLTKPFIN